MKRFIGLLCISFFMFAGPAFGFMGNPYNQAGFSEGHLETLEIGTSLHLLDDVPIKYGTDEDIWAYYDETTDDRLEWDDGTNLLMWLEDGGTTGSLGVTGDVAVGVSAATPGTIVQHDAGTTTFYDDGNDTSVVVGPVTDGENELTVGGAFALAPTARSSGEYWFYFDLTDRDGGIFPDGGPFKTYIYNTEVDREATEDMTGDSRDVMYKGVYRNYGQGDSGSNAHGVGVSVRNESGGTLNQIKGGEFGLNTKSGATSTNATGIESTVEVYGEVTTDLYGVKVDIRNEGTEATNQYGMYVTNTDNSTANASDAALYVTDAGTNTGWDYGIDLDTATIGTAEIRGHEGEIIFNDPDGTWDFSDANLTTTGLGTIAGLTFPDPGTDSNSDKLTMVADNSTTAQTGEIFVAYGANPYFRFSPPNASGTATATLDMRSDKMTIGSGVANIDFELIFDGETSDGSITYMEDEDRFDFDNDVAVGGNLTVASIHSATTTVTAAGPTDDLDVSGVNTVLIDTSSNNVTLGGMTGGVAGQQLRVVIVDATANTTLENAEGTGNQDIYLESAGDETKTTTYGGWVLECDGTHWYQVAGSLNSGGGGATAWDDIGNPDANDEIDFGAYAIELNVTDFQIGDGGGANYIGIDGTPTMTFNGTADIDLPADSVDAADLNFNYAASSSEGGAATTVTVSDDESTADAHEVAFTTDNANLESDGDFTYNPSTGTVAATEFSGGGSGLTGISASDVAISLEASDTTCWPVFIETNSSPQSVSYNSSFTFDANTATLSATEFSGGGGSLTGVDAATGDSATAFFDTGAVEVSYGGTGASTLTDGGVLLGSGTSAITAMGVLGDGEMIVGDGTADPVPESGAVLRTSIGVGTANTPQFTGVEIGHASDTTLARSGAGVATIEGKTITVADTVFTMGDTVQAFGADDATPDVSEAATGVNNIFQTANANPTTITDFDDTDDHSEFSDGDWFLLRVDDANTTIDFSANANIEGNAGVDFTGDSGQITYILFVFEDSRWNAVNFQSGLSAPTTLALSSLDMTGGTLTADDITINDGETLIFDESAADPNDADVVLSGTDGVLKITSANGANNEDLTIDVDGTANAVTFGTTTGVTEINTTLQFATTGDIMGAINISSKTAATYTVGTDDAHESYGTLFINGDNDAIDFTLPSAVAGMSACFMQGQGVTGAITVQPNAGDYLVVDGVRGTAATDYTSSGAGGDKICVVCIDATDWIVTSESGTWSE